MKRLWIVLITLLILPYQSTNSTVEVKRGNIFSSSFTNEYEIIYFVFRNGDFFSFTTRDKDRVQVNAVFIRSYFASQKRKLTNVVIIIHNHPHGCTLFSDGDIMFYELLRAYGFNGSFLLYANGKIYMY